MPTQARTKLRQFVAGLLAVAIAMYFLLGGVPIVSGANQCPTAPIQRIAVSVTKCGCKTTVYRIPKAGDKEFTPCFCQSKKQAATTGSAPRETVWNLFHRSRWTSLDRFRSPHAIPESEPRLLSRPSPPMGRPPAA